MQIAKKATGHHANRKEERRKEMQTSKKLLIALCAIFCASCASHSPIVQNGKGGYFLAAQQSTGYPGLGNLESELYAEAEQHCRGQGKAMQVEQVEKTKPPYVLGNYPRVELHFACR